jgi:peptidoglycan/xylan/chitin deacetylase (PgdA/CDA1 family)
LLAAGRLPRRAAVITFDDGYADNYTFGLPLLKEFDVSATVFLATGALGKDREFWWDELEKALLRPGRLPEGLTIEGGLDTQTYHLGAAATLSESDAARGRSWHSWEGPPTPRHAFYLDVWKRLLPLRADQQCEILDAIARWASVNTIARASHRVLSIEEAESLARNPLIEIGAHTVTHLSLPAHQADTQAAEIKASKTACEDLAGREVISFSYPYGHLSEETTMLVREAGFVAGCTTRSALMDKSTARLQIPRLQAMDWTGDEFAQRLSQAQF